MTDQRRYARLYHDLRTDAYEVYSDGPLAGAWLQLFLEADTAWPEPGQLPREVDTEQYQRLLDLDEVRTGSRPYTFRMKRLDLDRLPVAERQRKNANKRWKTDPEEPEHIRQIRSYWNRNAAAMPQTDIQTVTDNAHETAPSEGASRAPRMNGEPQRLKEIIGSFEDITGQGKR